MCLVTAIGCTDAESAEHESSATASGSLSFSYTEPNDLPVTSSNPFSSGYAGSGYVDDTGWGNGDPAACRSCSFTNADDLASGLRGHEQSRSLNASLSTELGSYANNLWSYGTNNGLKGRMQAAESDVTANFGGSYASDLYNTIDDIASLIELFPGASGRVSVTKPVAKTWTIAFEPVHARVLIQASSGTFNFQPMLHRDTRFRGARSYCAMRQAAREQRDSGDTLDSLGEQSAGNFWLWDYGKATSTVKVGAPLQVGREPGQTEVTSTGANAYAIPVAIGAKVTPLEGPLLPTFPEIVHPLVWVTGDAEVRSDEGSRKYLNAQHADFWTGQYVEDAQVVIEEVVLFSWGVVDLMAAGGLSMTMGKPTGGLCNSEPKSNLADGRVWFFDAAASCTTWPGYLHRSNEWDVLVGLNRRPSDFASDAPMEMLSGLLVPYENDGSYEPWGGLLPSGFGMTARFLANDDRSVALLDRVEESLSLSVGKALDFGPVHAYIAGETSVSSETNQLTVVRDHLSLAEGTPMLPFPFTYQNGYGNAILPQSNFLVTSETKHESTFDAFTVKAGFEMHLDFWFGSVDVEWQQDFFKLGQHSDTQGPLGAIERQRLRVGESSDFGNDFSQEGTTGRAVASHLPTPSGSPHWFASWPDGTGEPRDVPACLADTSAPDDPPAPEEGAPGQPQSGETCWYGPGRWCGGDACGSSEYDCEYGDWGLPSNACTQSVLEQWLANFNYLPSLEACLGEMMAYLCSGTHKEQIWGGEGRVVARVYSTSDDSAIESIFNSCVQLVSEEVGPSNASEAKCYGLLLGQTFKVHACKADGTLDGEAPQ